MFRMVKTLALFSAQMVIWLSPNVTPQSLQELYKVDTNLNLKQRPIEPIVLDSTTTAELFRETCFGEPDFSNGYAQGIDEALAEIREERITWYAYGLRMYGGNIDEETGLPVIAIAGCNVNSGVIGRARAHDSTIAVYIEEHGLPAYSRKPWMNMIISPRRAFDSLSLVGPVCDLMPFGNLCENFQAGFRVRLGKWKFPYSEDDADWLYVSRINDSTEFGDFACYPDERVLLASLVWGPTEAEIAFLKLAVQSEFDWRSGPQYVVLDLRTGGQIEPPGFVIYTPEDSSGEE